MPVLTGRVAGTVTSREAIELVRLPVRVDQADVPAVMVRVFGVAAEATDGTRPSVSSSTPAAETSERTRRDRRTATPRGLWGETRLMGGSWLAFCRRLDGRPGELPPKS